MVEINWIPFIILFGFSMMGLGVELINNGEKHEETYDFGISFIAKIINWGLICWGIGLI